MAYNCNRHHLKVNIGPLIGSLSRLNTWNSFFDVVNTAFAKPTAIYPNMSPSLRPRSFTK